MAGEGNFILTRLERNIMKQRRHIYIPILLNLLMLPIVAQFFMDQLNISKADIVHYVSIKKVESQRATVLKYAKEYDVEEHTDLLLAMMYQESKGRGLDPMQASESYCGTIGCINDRDLSIKQGVAYFKKTLDKAEGDVPLAIQAYNFGIGFVHYVKEADGDYSLFNAIQFSKKMYDNADDQTHYTCLRKEARQFKACYGDIYYVRDVMAHMNNFTSQLN